VFGGAVKSFSGTRGKDQLKDAKCGRNVSKFLLLAPFTIAVNIGVFFGASLVI